MKRPSKAPRPSKEDALLNLHCTIGGHLDDILTMFKPGAKAAVIVRIPGNDESDVLVTNDECDDLIKALERSKEREQNK